MNIKSIYIRRAFLNPIQDVSFRGISLKGLEKGSLPKICHTSWNDESLHSYTLPKEDPIKSKNHGTHPLSSADIINFSPEIGKFCYIKKYRYRLDFDI